MLATLCLLWLAACPGPEPEPDDDDATDDDDSAVDDDDSAVDDDDSAVDDDDTTEEPTPDPLPMLTPPGAAGVPGTMVGLRAVGEWEAVSWTSNQVEVWLEAPAPDGPPPPAPPPKVDADLVEFDRLLKASLEGVLEGGDR